jgi:hypothetical protein
MHDPIIQFYSCIKTNWKEILTMFFGFVFFFELSLLVSGFICGVLKFYLGKINRKYFNNK